MAASTHEVIQKPLSNHRSGPDSPGRSHSRRLSLIVIFSVALLGRLIAVGNFLTVHPWNWLYSHPWEMGLLANSLLHGQGYSSPFGGSTGPTAFIAPGYPTLIAAIFWIFGIYTHASVLVILGMQILLGLLTIWLIMYVAREMLDSRAATVAGAFWAVSLPLWWIPAIFWETSISACSLIGMIALAIRCRQTPTRAAWILLGACCGIIALINPALLPSLLAIMGWLAYHTRRVTRTAPVIGLLALLLVFSAWPIRNAYRFHAFIPLRSTVGFELWMGNRPGATGRLDESVFPMFNKQELASYLSKGEVAYTRDKSRQAQEYIRANSGTFLKLSTRRFFRFWAGTGNLDASPTYEIHALLTTIFGLAGLVLIYRRGMRGFAILMSLPLLLFPLPYYITHSEFRYRLNIDPILTVLAAYAITQLAAVWSWRRSRTQLTRSTDQTLIPH
jgi:Dolichyl-phosphate-mannose-protein mannosyltransferase